MKAMLCDVCKEQIIGRHYKIKGYFPSWYGETCTQKLDICSDCWTSFKEWVKEAKE